MEFSLVFSFKNIMHCKKDVYYSIALHPQHQTTNSMFKWVRGGASNDCGHRKMTER
jgi:hypothetical protein